jgi:hypothetical protein
VSNPSTGNYSASYTPTLNGPHRYRWVATGAVVDADSGTFEVGCYCQLADLKTSLGITDTDDDDALVRAIGAASRAIDQATGTHFYQVTEARLYSPLDCYDVWVDRFTSTTGLVVKTGTDGSTWTTVTSTDVVTWPNNAPSRGGAYCRLRVPTGVLPVGYIRPTVQVTASWGWHFVPTAVAEACLIKAAKLFRRKDSPEGVAGTSEFGVVRISRHEDPDVLMLLAPYMSVGLA